jgi:hypothetical protein
MPNWVKNRLTIEGGNAETVLAELTTADAYGERNFDFNKIIPMPESLHITAGSTTDSCVALYLTAVNPNVEYYGNKKDKVSHAKYSKMIEKLRASDKKVNGFDLMLPVEKIAEYEKSVIGESTFDAGPTREAAIAYGKRAVDNVLEYGHMNWYDWSIANWGTKWNAYESRFDGCTVEFDTAWSDVSELMRQLSGKYPDDTFYYDFAEEQAGLYTGDFTFENGEETGGGYFDKYSREAYEKYFEFWGGAEDYKFNKRTKTYEYIEGETESGGAEM